MKVFQSQSKRKNSERRGRKRGGGAGEDKRYGLLIVNRKNKFTVQGACTEKMKPKTKRQYRQWGAERTNPFDYGGG